MAIVVEVELGPIGDEVPGTGAPEAKSAAEMSPCVDGTPPPRSMKRDRSFISKAWMSSGLPWDSEEASLLVSHSPECVCPGRAAVCGWECTKVGWTEGTFAVTGWSPTEEEGGEERGWEGAEGTS